MTQLTRVQTVDFGALELAVPIRFPNASSDSCRISIASQYNNTASGSNEGYVRTPSANLCASVTVPADKMVSSCSRVAVWHELVFTVSGAYRHQ